jgi:hypothetical protein
MRNLRSSLTLALLLVLIMGACARGAEETADSAAPEAPMEAPSAGEGGESEFSGGDAIAQPLPEESLIIYTGDISIVVADTEATAAEIQALTASMGGRVVSSSFFQSTGGAFAGTITIRVPVERFDEAMSRIQEMAVEVRRADRSSEDVTEEYVDLQARLENLEATADRVRSFLEEANDVEEALAVNQELSRLEAEIEAHKGRIQFLENRADFSTITVSLTPDELAQPIEVGGWRLGGAAREAVEALLGALQGLARIVVWIVIFIVPLALVILLPLAILARLALRRMGRRSQRDAVDES